MSNKFSLTLLLILVSVIVFNQYQYSVNNPKIDRVFSNEESFNVIDPALASGVSLNDTTKEVKNYLALSLVDIEKKKEVEEKKEEVVVLPDIPVESWLAYNLTEKKEIFSYEPEKIWPTASLAKLATSVITAEEVEFDTLVSINERAVNTEEVAGYFEVGEIFSAKDLVTSLFLVSSNDGAVALAENIGYERFVSEMNKLARILSMKSTFFVDPSGLSSDNITTANDLRLLMEYMYSNRPELIYFSRQPNASIMDRAYAHVKNYESINEFAGRSDFIGGKTGFTYEARENLVSIFSKDNQAILIIVLGSEDRFQDTLDILNSIKL